MNGYAKISLFRFVGSFRRQQDQHPRLGRYLLGQHLKQHHEPDDGLPALPTNALNQYIMQDNPLPTYLDLRVQDDSDVDYARLVVWYY